MRPHTSSSSSSSRSSSSFSLSAFSTLFLAFPALISANLDCKDIPAQGQHFDLSKLGGAFRVHYLAPPDALHGTQDNYTFTLDICNKLHRDKGVPSSEFCSPGTRVCGVNNEIGRNGNTTAYPIDIAGDYKLQYGRTIDAKFTLFRESKSHADANRQGFRAELNGGRLPANKKDGVKQKAIIEFVCDKEREGLEDDEKDDGDKEEDGDDKETKKIRRRADDGCEDSNASLRFCSYETEKEGNGDLDVLRLEWRTKYACEDVEQDGGDHTHWGFFTWFIIILFLAVAAYLIFGSWLNYNRYGARGWDLLPHGDTIRDIPYILKDWGRRVAGAVQGPGSRGGYSAV